MTSVLHITNGDVAAQILATKFPDHTVLPWRDVLHIGPVLLTKDLKSFDSVRVEFISSFFGMEPTAVTKQFQERRLLTENASSYESIRLWFEHDLYDQLQLTQVVDCLFQQGHMDDVFLHQSSDYLGEMSLSSWDALSNEAVLLEKRHWLEATQVWKSVCYETPERMLAVLRSETLSNFAHLRPALLRFLMELPAPKSGLNLTELNLLWSLEQGGLSQSELFQAVQSMESARFLADAVFHQWIEALLDQPKPLIESDANPNPWQRILRQTPIAQQVLSGALNQIELNGIDRWVGGCHLKSNDVWCFNDSDLSLSRPS